MTIVNREAEWKQLSVLYIARTLFKLGVEIRDIGSGNHNYTLALSHGTHTSNALLFHYDY